MPNTSSGKAIYITLTITLIINIDRRNIYLPGNVKSVSRRETLCNFTIKRHLKGEFLQNPVDPVNPVKNPSEDDLQNKNRQLFWS